MTRRKDDDRTGETEGPTFEDPIMSREVERSVRRRRSSCRGQSSCISFPPCEQEQQKEGEQEYPPQTSSRLTDECRGFLCHGGVRRRSGRSKFRHALEQAGSSGACAGWTFNLTPSVTHRIRQPGFQNHSGRVEAGVSLCSGRMNGRMDGRTEGLWQCPRRPS